MLVATDLKEAVAALEATGSYKYVGLRRTVDDSVPTLKVTLQKLEAPGHSLRLGIDYNSTYSSSNRSNAGIAFSLVFRSLLTENSRLTINAEIMDSPALGLIMLQPLGGNLFIEGFLLARQETETYYNTETTVSLQQTQFIEMGINLDSPIFPTTGFSLLSRYDQSLTQPGSL